LAIATAIESKIKSGGWAFLLTFIGVLLMFSIFGGVVPLWFVLVLIALVIGGIVFLKR
jgi:preprotein translocase subunit SecD